ncbi:MAG TPA: ABC transporter ATP-binding protein, partial [Dermatophilaceae bacterium]|nr:ABC transporter ATP-binding protein [Dermatophilaceae bacterium]
MSLTAEPTTRTLPVADMDSVRAHTRTLLRRHRGSLATVVGLHALAAIASLVAPRTIGLLVDEIMGDRSLERVNQLALGIAAAVVVQTLFTWFARRASFVMGETVFAELREDFMERVVELPLSTVERAGTGDLVSRTTNDVEALSHVIRFGIPSIFVGAVTTTITVVAAFTTGWMVALPIAVGVPILWLSTRRYLRDAPAGYLRERATYAVLNGVVTESADGGRTVDALRLGSHRRRRMDRALRDCYDAEIYTLGLRMRWFPAVEFAFFLPVAATLVWGGWLITGGHTTAGTVIAVALYVQQMAGPLDELISWLDEVQVGATSLARVIG